MKRFLTIMVLGLVLAIGTAYSSALADDPVEPPVPAVPGPSFVDEDGDGICDNFAKRAALGQRRGRMGNRADIGRRAMLDADSDGIPNGQDPDFQRPYNGRGQRLGRGGLGNGSCVQTASKAAN